MLAGREQKRRARHFDWVNDDYVDPYEKKQELS